MGDLPAEGLSTPAAADDDYASLANQIVDIFYKIYGTHPGFRVNHAKGLVATGSFVATPAASALSRAALFDGSSIPFTVRFSNDGGFPAIPDGAPGNIKGMAVKFHMVGGAEVDIVMLAIKTFPMATGEEFRDLLMAISESPDGTPKPTRFDEFAASHPTVPAAFGTAGTPDSFAHEEYCGLNAFIFIDKAGRRQAVRYIMTPDELVYLTADEAARQPPDFLIDDLPQRIAKKPVVFHLTAQLAEAGDQTKDPSQPWPNDRQVLDLGVLTLHKALADSREVQKDLLFLPTNLPDGIELSDDRMPVIRSAVYGVAFTRRSR
ncbi:catalase family peroxidase [Caballeronia sordidicola]|uniref:catalase family peroxidase n=1 Tax=Caballeronia sordidicola TaxID=196367 RepID=UPI0004CFF21E|nr:catalase family peroxidase [Caballeronia sordidicola]